MRLQTTIALIFALGVAAVPSLVRSATTSDDTHAAPTLTVIGRGELSRAPDVATVALTIVTSDDNAGRALSDNNRRFNALTAKLGTLGVAATDISSASISSYFNPRPPGAANAGPGQEYGFVVTRNVQVTVNALSATGSVVDAATGAGASQVNGVSYGFRDRRAVERAALAGAVQDAGAQAVAIAAAAHVQIVRILHIGSNDAGPPGRIMPMAMSAARSAGDNVPTTIAPSDLDVSASVSVTYLIR